jgi:hypothetical protein
MSEISIYETNSGCIEVRLERETVWLSQEQMAALFDVKKAAVSKHLKNIFSSGELEREPTVSKMETVQQEGARRVTRQIEHFNLDAVISVGYRVNSARATPIRFRTTPGSRVCTRSPLLITSRDRGSKSNSPMAKPAPFST